MGSDLVEFRTNLLTNVEHFLRKYIRTRGGLTDPTEMKMWLISSLANFHNVGEFRTRFIETAENKVESDEKDFIKQVLLMACQNKPQEVMKVLANDGRIFQRFFRDNDDRVAKWFSHFKFSGKNEYGARALERYFFDAREGMWEKLKWTGRHDVTPCVAVQKRNLLMELDVLHAVDMLVHDDSDFWNSTYFRECIASGDIMTIDFGYFVTVLEDKFDGQDSALVHGLIRNYLKTEHQKELAQQLLRFFSDKELLKLVYHCLPSDKKLTFVQYVISESKWKTVDDLILYHALATNTHILVNRIFRDEEGQDLTNEFDEMMADDGNQSQEAYHEWLTKSGTSTLWSRFIALEGLLIFYRLKRFITTREGFEGVFGTFQVSHNAQLDQEQSEQKEKKHKHKHKKRRHSRSPSPSPAQFLGWKLSNSDTKEREDITYGIPEAPQYLHNVFVSRLFNTVIL